MKKVGYRTHKPQIYIGTDHAGFVMKTKLIPFIQKLGYEVIDCGAYRYDDLDDYPDFIHPVAKAVSLNPKNILGIILGGSGQGEAIVANKFPNVRAIVYYGRGGIFKDALLTIKLGRFHNDSNVLSLGARMLDFRDAKRAVKTWLSTDFSNGERHVRRIKKIEMISKLIKHNNQYD
jgi:ribose 5-phosphate isomerase B